MGYLNFSKDLKKEFKKTDKLISKTITRAGIEAIKAARQHTPAPWNGGQTGRYASTGTLYNAWQISTSRRSQHTRQRHKQSKNNLPDFKFRTRFDKRIYIFNNMDYASYVEQGINPRTRPPNKPPPRPMMRSAEMAFKRRMSFGI